MTTRIFPPAWVPQKPGDQIAGSIIARRARVHPKGEFPAYRVFDVETDEGTFAIHAYPATLRKAMSTCTTGDTVRITYAGCRASRSGRTYKRYVVESIAP